MSEFKYGLNLLVYTAAFSTDQLDLVARVADMGFDGVEVPFNDLSILDPSGTRKACEAAGVDMTACCVIMPGQSISSTDPDERVRGVERLKRMVDITADMGGNIVSGPLYAPVGHLTGRARSDEEFNWCADGLAAGAEHAAAAGVTLVIEPLNRFETYLFNTAADAVKLVETIGSENLKIQIDTFHGNIEEKDTAAAIRATGKWLGHFHASESDRGELGTGQVRWAEVFAALHEIDYSGWVTIESFATGILDLCAAACIWRPIYESADGLAKDGLAFLKQAAGA